MYMYVRRTSNDSTVIKKMQQDHRSLLVMTHTADDIILWLNLTCSQQRFAIVVHGNMASGA